MNAPIKLIAIRRLPPTLLLIEGLAGAAFGACVGSFIAFRTSGIGQALALRIITDRGLRGAVGITVGMIVADRVSRRPHAWFLGSMFGLMASISPITDSPAFDPSAIPLILRIAHSALVGAMGGCMAGVLDRWLKITPDPRSAMDAEGRTTINGP